MKKLLPAAPAPGTPLMGGPLPDEFRLQFHACVVCFEVTTWGVRTPTGEWAPMCSTCQRDKKVPHDFP